PLAEGLNLRLGDVLAVFGAQLVLQQHLEAEGQSLVAFDCVDAEHLVVGATDREGVFRSEAVDCRHWCPLCSKVPRCLSSKSTPDKNYLDIKINPIRYRGSRRAALPRAHTPIVRATR